MDTILRATFVYFILLLIFRLSGKRTLAQITTFDLVLTLIISEAIQQALVDHDHSLTNALLLVTTLMGLNIIMSLVKQRSKRIERLMEGSPIVLIEEGNLHRDRMDKERVDEADILEAARELQGLSRLDQIQYAVVEKSGQVTVIPKQGEGGEGG
jgi:uncharacterized membrane protein YcaP (DUF421 family)